MSRPGASPRNKQELAVCILFYEAPHALEGRTYLQKLMYLFQHEADRRWFVFNAGDYGPFSKDLYAVLDYLIEHDYVTEEEHRNDDGLVRFHYMAGPCIEDVFGHGDHDDLRTSARGVFDEYPSQNLKKLLERVYTEYPETARNSVY